VNGLVLITAEVTYDDRERETGRKETEWKVIQKPVDRIVLVTRKPPPPTSVVRKSWEEAIPYKTVTRTEGTGSMIERRIIRAGVNGLVRITANVTYDGNDRKIGEVETARQVIQKPVDKIVLIQRSDPPPPPASPEPSGTPDLPPRPS
jgi:hypothetical protein